MIESIASQGLLFLLVSLTGKHPLTIWGLETEPELSFFVFIDFEFVRHQDLLSFNGLSVHPLPFPWAQILITLCPHSFSSVPGHILSVLIGVIIESFGRSTFIDLCQTCSDHLYINVFTIYINDSKSPSISVLAGFVVKTGNYDNALG